MRASRALTVVVLCAVLVAAAALARVQLLAGVLSLATGYDVRVGALDLGWTHAVLRDVRVAAGAEPLLAAPRIDLEYRPRDLFPGGTRRLGLVAVDLTAPAMTIVRRANASFNVSERGWPQVSSATPLRLRARIRGGTIELRDAAPLEPDLAVQRIVDVTADAEIDSAGRTTARAGGSWIGRRAAGAPLIRWPLGVRSTIDYGRGFATHHLRADALPLRGALAYAIHSSAVRFEDGVLRRVDVRAFAVDIVAGTEFPYRLGGSADLNAGRLAIYGLAQPVTAVRGRLDLSDDGLTTSGASAELAGLPLRIRGGMTDLFAAPHFWLGVVADGAAERARDAVGLLADRPLHGPLHLETLVAARFDDPLVRTAISSPQLFYDRLPLVAAGVVVDYARNVVSFALGHGRFGPLTAAIDGLVRFESGTTPLAFVLRVTGATAAVPYLESLASGQAVVAAAVLSGTVEHGLRTGATFESAGPGGRGSGFVAIDDRGVGEFGPFAFERHDGSTLAGALRVDRAHAASAGWLAARGYPVAVRERAGSLPGLDLPPLPPLSGIVDGELAGAGGPQGFELAGSVRSHAARVGRYPLGNVAAAFAGTPAGLRLGTVTVDGPLGRFAGSGALAAGVLALRGRYDGMLAGLEPLTGPIGARGSVHGPVAALIDARRIVVQTTGADLSGGSVRGIAVERAAGTLATDGQTVRVVAADARIGGARAVAAQREGDDVAVAAVEIPAAAVRGAGLPLDAGRLAVFGVADLRGPRFHGSVDLRRGSVAGYPVHGWADVAFAGTSLEVAGGAVALGGTYSRVTGRVSGLGGSAPRYDLEAYIPVADLAQLAGDAGFPSRGVSGSFAAALHLGGAGAAPTLGGLVALREGAVHGLAFRDATGRIDAGFDGAGVTGGRVTIGSTSAAFGGRIGRGRIAATLDAPAADLADLNDFFDQSNVLAGRGAVALDVSAGPRGVVSSGAVALAGVRVRRLPLGAVALTWRPAGPGLTVAADLAGPAGNLHAAGTVVPGAGELAAALRGARIDGDLNLSGVDLATWLPAAGVTLPVAGLLSAGGHVAGAYPRLTVDAEAAVTAGAFGPYPVRSASAKGRLAGDRVTADVVAADLIFADLSGSGSFGLSAAAPLDLHFHASTPDVGEALRRVIHRLPFSLAGALDIDATVRGTAAAPAIAAGLDLEDGRVAGVAVRSAVADVETDLRAIRLNSADVEFERGRAFVAGSLPITLRPPGLGPPGAALSLTLDAREVDLAPLAAFFPAGTSLGGTLGGRLALEGTVESPRILGNATLSHATYASRLETSPIRNLDATLTFKGTSVALEALHANLGSGTIDAGGELDLPIPGAPSRGYAIDITARAAQLSFPAYGYGRFDGTARIVRGPQRPIVSGDLTLSEARIPFAAVSRAAGAAGAEDAQHPLDVGFDLQFRAGRNVRVRSPIIDIGTTGALRLSGTFAAPRLAGVLTATQGGIFSTYQRAFRIQQATVTFDPLQGVVPTIDLRATAHVTNPDPDPNRNAIGSAEITVTVTGPADAFAIAFSSDPSYPQAQIVGLLVDAPLFGALNFNAQAAANGTLAGAPGESNVLLPPGVTPYQGGSFGFQQEAFSLLNTQLTQRLLAPLETFAGGALGLTDLELTVDYGGRIGYTARRTLNVRNGLAVTLGQILSFPARTQVGFDLRPDPVTSATFTYFWQTSAPAYATATSSENAATILTGVQPLSNRQGFRFTITRHYP